MGYENLTTFSEVDASGYWSQTATRNTFTNLTNGDSSYVYKDYGASYFSGDFEHWFEFQRGSNAGHVVGAWALVNTPNTFIGMASGGSGLYFLLYADGILLGDHVSGFANQDFTALSAGTTYYAKIWRTGTTLEVKIYTSSSDRTNDVNDIRHVTVNNVDTTTAYRYLQVGFSYGAGGSTSRSGWMENFDLSGGAPSQETFEGTDIITLADYITEQETQDDSFSMSDSIEIYAVKTSDIDNKINIVKEVISDFSQNIHTAILTKPYFANIVNAVNGQLLDIDNDIRTHAESVNNINNDVRVLADYQEPGDVGFQSLGKEYIKVYIGGSEQTDLNVDTVSITKIINGAHTATFELGRAYDSSKPAVDSTVTIYYHTWLLYSGYITSITPASTPEAIRINCSDDYWKNNRSKVYFFVGHKPTDNKELYYYYISTALSNAIGWNPGIGYFVPQTMSLFGTGQSDAITDLITNCGNYAWYYDESGNKQLWTAGAGSIVNLERQEIGTNLGLYQVISHTFTENISNIVNKLRVQMGDLVIRRFNTTGGTKEYPAYVYEYTQVQALPDWDSDYEVLATKENGLAFGFNYLPDDPTDRKPYEEVFKKYEIPQLDSELASWSDVHPPTLFVDIPWSLWWQPVNFTEEELTEGFTIDYENGKLTLSQPLYLAEFDEHGEVTRIRAPEITLYLWKKRLYSNTENEGDDPESDISNPLMFFTDKVGSYSETITELLNLTNLSIQYGGRYRDADGNWVHVPSWNDTAFAQDYAYWQLSNSAYKEIRGSINLTLDAVVAYGINLSNRIYISGVTDDYLNISSMTYNMSNFQVTIQLQNGQYYKRTVSIPSHGE